VQIFVAVVNLYMVALFVTAIFSWLPPQHRQNEFYGFLRAITDPVLGPIRRVVPPVGGVDFSPLLAILLIQIILRAFFF